MLKIGEFSKLSRVSIRMLRHYDEIDLLKPALVDRFTEYRYYNEDQLPQCSRITALKELGFSLAEIREMLPLFHDPKAIDERLARRQTQLEDDRQEIERKLLLLDTARKRLRKEETMQYDITIKTFPERYAASLRMTIPRYEDEGLLWQKLCEETDDMRLIPADPCLCAASRTWNTFVSVRCRLSRLQAASSAAAMTRLSTSMRRALHGLNSTGIHTQARCSISTM